MSSSASSDGHHVGGNEGRPSNSARGECGRDSADEGATASKHPKYLKGREIGLWYAQRNKTKPNARGDSKQSLREFLCKVCIDRNIAGQLDTCMKLLEKEMLDREPDPGRPVTRLMACGSSSRGRREPANPSEAVQASRAELPVYKARAEIIQTINENQVTVISGETGSGKTTQVPQFILDRFLEDESQESCFIVCTQPRRISAITVAERVAQERGEIVGENSVGYKIRLESKDPKGDSGKILFCTTGIVLQFLQSDPLLKNVTHLIVDEVHERSIDSDLLLGVLRERILPQRPSLKVICMSATLDSSTFLGYFGEPCGRILVEGKLFPIKNQFLEDFLPLLRYKAGRSTESDRRAEQAQVERAHSLERYGYDGDQVRALSAISMTKIDADLVVACVEHICATADEGAILIFLPGWDGISEVCRKLSELSGPANSLGNTVIVPLHSMLPTSDQRLAFEIPPSGVRKIIVSTSIAETSITIEDVVYVIDSGKTKLSTIDVAKNNLSCLGQLWISKANASQRLGRAGRVRPGECYKLYTKMDFESMEEYEQPEMVRSSLENLILYVKELGLGEPEVFLPQLITPPSIEAVENSIEFLIQLKALDRQANVTTLGKYLTSLPTEPRLGKMLILGTLFGCLHSVMSVCAALDFKDPFFTPLGRRREVDAVRLMFARDSESDHMMIANAVEKAIRRDARFMRVNFLSSQTIKMLENLRKQYKSHLTEQGLLETRVHRSPQTLRAVICGGLYPGIAMGLCKRKDRSHRSSSTSSGLKKIFTESERHISFHPKSVLAKQREFSTLFFAYFLKQRGDAGVSLFDATAVNPLSLLLFAADCDYDSRNQIFTINEWMKIRCEPNDAMLVNRLRTSLDYVIDCFLRRDHNGNHKDFIELLSHAFDKEQSEIGPAARRNRR